MIDKDIMMAITRVNLAIESIGIEKSKSTLYEMSEEKESQLQSLIDKGNFYLHVLRKASQLPKQEFDMFKSYGIISDIHIYCDCVKKLKI